MAIAIAILRYHLFDIDRIISNAIGYGLVTAVLFAVFGVVNLVLVSQVSPLVNNEGVAVAASTLLVAAMFNPLRTRVQRGWTAASTGRGTTPSGRSSTSPTAFATSSTWRPWRRDLATTARLAVEPTSAVPLAAWPGRP